MVQVCYLSAAGDLLSLGVDGNAVDGVLEEHVAAVLEYGAGGVVQLVGVSRRLEYLHRPPRLGHTCIRVIRNIVGFGSLDQYISVLRIWIRDPVPFEPWDPGWKKFGSGINIRDPQHSNP
jgi:hypothetical protein